MENVLVAFSNLYALLPIYRAIRISNWLTAIILTGAMVSSIVYHLLECHKHQMPGLWFGRSEFIYHLTINIDRLFALLSVYIFYDPTMLWNHRYLAGIALASMTISETIYRYEKRPYIFFHIIWHILAFHLAYLFVK